MSQVVTSIRAVTFDLDGTLYDARRVRAPMMWKNLLRLRALRVGKAVREELRTRAFESGEALRREEARIAGERLDLPADRARALLDDIYDASLCSVLPRARDTRVRGVLDALVARGIGLAVISDRRVDDKLAALGLAGLPWRARMSADDSGALKPSPRPFLETCAALGVEPGEALHVGDRDDTDGAGARTAGMRFLLVDGPGDLGRAVEALDGRVPTSP